MDTSHVYKRLQDFIPTASKPLVVILGPTASGKTSFSIACARCIEHAEIINADSRQLYQYLDIGTAKITPEEMQGIPHHLLDVLDPKEEVTAAWYKKEAQGAIHDLHCKGKIPLLVGGSMLYISAVIDGLRFPPGADERTRSRLDAEYENDQGEALYAKLLEIDPDTALAFSKKNKPYLLRAMEIYEITKKKPSEARQKNSCPYDLLILGIDRPRQELTRRINLRTAELFTKGWVEEVRGLLKKGYTADDPGMKSHGYREIIAWLDSGKPSLEELQESIAAKTRQYAKRQLTWWRHDERIQWITDPDTGSCSCSDSEKGSRTRDRVPVPTQH